MLHVIPQLFFGTSSSGVKCMLAKIVDEFVPCGFSDQVNSVIKIIQDHFTPRTTAYGPGLLSNFALNIIQHDIIV